MLEIAAHTVRRRLASFAGAIIAAALAVGLVAATGSLMASALTASGAGRFAAVDAVVQGNATTTVGASDAAGGVATVYPPPRLPAGLVARVGAAARIRCRTGACICSTGPGRFPARTAAASCARPVKQANAPPVRVQLTGGATTASTRHRRKRP